MKPNAAINLSSLARELQALGLRAGDTVMVHSSLRALGVADPELIVQALLRAIGATGTLLMPALTYAQQPPTFHDTRSTPACVGALPEYFRTRPGTSRSLHPTHSVCAIGAHAAELLADHIRDDTPCGPHSPFHRLLHCGGRILMLGCGLRPNTTMHAIEEYTRPPYLFGPPLRYTLIDGAGERIEKEYTPHNFHGFAQRYDRVAPLLAAPQLRSGVVGQANADLIDAGALLAVARAHLLSDPLFFVERAPLNVSDGGGRA